MKTKLFTLTILAILMPLLLGGCFLNDDVATDQMGVVMDAGRILRCEGPGVYTDWGTFTDLVEVGVGTVTFQVTDPEVATSDNQLVGLTVTIQARRKGDCESLTNILTNWSVIKDDNKLIEVVSATTRESMKVGVRGFALEGLLNDRNGLANSIQNALRSDSDEYSVDIVNVTIENIALSPDYAAQLQEKALLTAKVETELKRQDLIRQAASNNILEQQQNAEIQKAQLDAEKAKTSVQVEIASRDGKVIEAKNAIYKTNSQAFELERLRLIQTIFGEKSVFYFLPTGTDLTMLFNPNSATVVPIP